MPREWDVRFPPLLDSDVRGYRDPDGRAAGPGRRGIWEDGREVLANNVEPSVGEDGAVHSFGANRASSRRRHRPDSFQNFVDLEKWMEPMLRRPRGGGLLFIEARPGPGAERASIAARRAPAPARRNAAYPRLPQVQG